MLRSPGMTRPILNVFALLVGLCSMLATAPLPAASVISIESKNIRVEFDPQLHSRIVAKFDGKATPVGDFGPSEFVATAAAPIQNFNLTGHKFENVRDETGHGRRLTITGSSGGLQKTVVVTVYDEVPRMAFFQVHYLNQSEEALRLTGWTNNRYTMTAAGSDEPAFWSYQSGSYRNRPDWVLPLKVNFKQENFLGMNATDYGGGTPVADVWRRDIGIAVGHLEHAPKLVSLPVAMPDATHASLALTFASNTILKPKATLDTFNTFVAVHQRDYFQSFQDYSAVMQKRLGKFIPAPDSAFGPIWCAWGYGKTFTPSQVEQALPEVKKLGFSWVGVDDGWQTNEGDWALLPSKFPNGDRDMSHSSKSVICGVRNTTPSPSMIGKGSAKLMVRKNAMGRLAGTCHAARRVKVSAIAAALSSPEPSPRTAVASLPRAISARPAARALSTVTASTRATNSSSGIGRPRVIIWRASCSMRAPELSSAISSPAFICALARATSGSEMVSAVLAISSTISRISSEVSAASVPAYRPNIPTSEYGT